MLAIDEIRMGFAEAVGSNHVNDLPCFHAPYFSKKGQAKMLKVAILVKSLDSCLAFYYFSFRRYIKIMRTLILGHFQSMKRERQGQYVTISTVGEKARAFIPAPLPPNPSIEWTPELHSKFDHALLALGRLDSISTFLPDISLFLYMYVRKEAVLSSMIEGTQSSLSDLLLFELDMEPGVPLDDVREVSNYVAALDYGLKRLSEGFPLSLRLIKEMHAVLLSKGRGSNQTPGRISQNPELDRRHPARQCSLCSAAGRASVGLLG